jgi:hypothetical protein
VEPTLLIMDSESVFAIKDSILATMHVLQESLVELIK